MPYSFEEAKDAIERNPVSMFQLEDPALVKRVLEAHYKGDTFRLGRALYWKRAGETYIRKCWVGDPADPERKLLRPEPVTVAQVVELIKAGLVSPIEGSIVHHIELEIRYDGTDAAHYHFTVEAWPTFNCLGSRPWTDELELPPHTLQSIEEQFYEFQGGLHAWRYSSKEMAEAAAALLNANAISDLQRLGRLWFVERQLFKPKPGEVDYYYWAVATWPIVVREFETRAHIAGTPEPIWDPLMPLEHRRLMTAEELAQLPSKVRW